MTDDPWWPTQGGHDEAPWPQAVRERRAEPVPAPPRVKGKTGPVPGARKQTFYGPTQSSLERDELALLATLATPSRFLTRMNQPARRLVARGMLKSENGESCCITALGLRALAEMMDNGTQLDAFALATRQAELKAAGAE